MQAIESVPGIRYRMVEGHQLHFYASEVASRIGIQGMREFHKAVARAVHACQSTDIPVEDNFRALYWDIGQGLFPDWKMSELGAGLL